MTTFDTIKATIIDLIAANEIDEAFDTIDHYLADYLRHHQSSSYAELIVYKRSYASWRREARMGLISRSDSEAAQTRLTLSLIQFLDSIRVPANQTLVWRPGESLTMEAPLTPDMSAFQQLLGINNQKGIAWLEKGLRAADSVGRARSTAGGKMGTGFQIAPGLLMTSSHLIPSAESARNWLIEFNYQQDADGRNRQATSYRLDASRFHASPENELDYAIVGILSEEGKPALEHWGALEINAQVEQIPGDRVSIIQHPNGRQKEIVFRQNEIARTWGHRLQYRADTLPGSSGSPVFNDEWQVVAIHQKGGNLPVNEAGDRREINQGVLMSAIKPDAGAYWPE